MGIAVVVWSLTFLRSASTVALPIPPLRQSIAQPFEEWELQCREGQITAGESGVAAPELRRLGSEAGDGLGGCG